MTRIFPIQVKDKNMNVGMIAFLRVMYYFGYLPFNWKGGDDEVRFEISKLKLCLMFAFDFALALWIPLYFVIWHRINLGDAFDLSLLLRPSYYVDLNDGVITTAISQMSYVSAALWLFWLYSYVGE